MNPDNEFDQIRDDVACGVIPPPPGFERYAPTAADWREMHRSHCQMDLENDYDERQDR